MIFVFIFREVNSYRVHLFNFLFRVLFLYFYFYDTLNKVSMYVWALLCIRILSKEINLM